MRSLIAGLLVACGGGASSPDALVNDSTPAVDAYAAAAHTPLPQVPTMGGPVLASPRLVTITFAGYPYTSTVEAFGDWVVGSSWLSTVGSEYGVGAGAHVAKVRLPNAAPAAMSTADIQNLIASGISDGTLPPIDDGVLYALYFPPTTTFLDGSLRSCIDFSGFHSESVVAGKRFVYAAIGACAGFVAGLTLGENVERTASHELIEAFTDPFTHSAIAFQLRDPANPWSYPEAELGDVCRLGWIVRDGDFVAQRIWSNHAAIADQSPCIPAVSAPYFNASIQPASVQIVAPGQTVTFTVTGWATAPVPDWRIHVPSTMGGAVEATASLDSASMRNGGTATLTLTVPADAPAASYGYLRLSSAIDDSELLLGAFWPVVVRTP
jgi:hypothetical protein